MIAYESQNLKKYEQRYSTYDLELIALVLELEMWRHYLLGKKFSQLTDHSSLTNFFDQSNLNS